jgi:hypothetical protein
MDRRGDAAMAFRLRLFKGDDAPKRPSDDLADRADVLVGGFLLEARGQEALSIKLDELGAAQTILKAEPELRAAVLMRIVCGRKGRFTGGDMGAFSAYFATRAMVAALLRKPLPLREEELVQVLEGASGGGRFFAVDLPRTGFIALAERHVSAHGMGEGLRRVLLSIRRQLTNNTEDGKLATRIGVMIGDVVAKPPTLQREDDAWAARALEMIDGADSRRKLAWGLLLAHCGEGDSARPNLKWLKRARELIDNVGQKEYATNCRAWLEVFIEDPPEVPGPENTLVLRGLVWAAACIQDEALVAAVGRAAETSFKKVVNRGPRSVKLGNACLFALSAWGTDRAVAELVRVRGRARHASTRKQTDGALGRAAHLRGESPEDLVEIAVPSFGLALPGRLTRELAGFKAELAIAGSTEATLTWTSAAGKALRSAPRAVKDGAPAELKELTKARKEIERTLTGQRGRLERLLIGTRTWEYAKWRERYMDHPLLAQMVRRLVWRFETSGVAALGMWRGDALAGADGKPLKGLDEKTSVAIWHPITSSAEEVLAWRTAIEGWEIVQPFKQAHREVYVLTDAERRTEVYSNRFAAHILRQHQMSALCQERGWEYRLAGTGFDSGGAVPTLRLPAHGLLVEYAVTPVEGDMSGSGISLFVASDQVAFRRVDGADRLALTEVPARVFSEVMRDVDLFVGVSSVGNDPTWIDGGRLERFDEYWRAYAFGDLAETGWGRRDVLSRLLPRLRIANVCTLDEKFLRVRGRLRTYKIHLGSGNILMEPNDQYLCIVPNQRDSKGGGAATVLLPFEGDRTLSIILSKAFMLAEDDKITDSSITRQIRRE